MQNINHFFYQRNRKTLWSLRIKHLWTLVNNWITSSTSKWITFIDIPFKTRVLAMQPFDLSFSIGFLSLHDMLGNKNLQLWWAIGYNETKKPVSITKTTSSFVFSCIAFLSLDSVSFNLVFAFSRSLLNVSFSLATEDNVKHDTSFSRVWI